MKTFSRVCPTLSCLMVLILSASTAAAETETLQLLGRSKVNSYSVELDESDWSWLRHKDTLLIGVSTPDYAPFDLTANGRDFEGITADYTELLGELLHIQIKVRRFDSRSEVIQAVKDGELDLVGTASDDEAKRADLVMSRAYVQDRPALINRTDDSRTLAPDLANKKVAMSSLYPSPELVRSLYPEADVQVYPSNLSALSAVAFGKADVYLGDLISANYLIDNNYLNNMKLASFPRLGKGRFSFALSRENPRLVRIIDSALASIPAGERIAILNRWGVREASISEHHNLQFSADEQRWLKEHPQVRVAVTDNAPPLSFFDGKGDFRGISADVLAMVSLRTGLKFDMVRTSASAQVEQLRAGKIDLVAAITPSVENESDVRFTRPYLATPLVLVSPVGTGSPGTSTSMNGKTIAFVRGTVLQTATIQQLSNVRMVLADDVSEAMGEVAKGSVDATVSPLVNARYLIARRYQDKLEVTGTVGAGLTQVSFATNRGALELYSILEKVLLSIPPGEMTELTNRWNSQVVIDDSYWFRNRAAIIQGFIVASVLLLVALVWIVYLRKLVRKRKDAEYALNNQIEFMRVLIDGTPAPIYVRDRQGCLVMCNSGYLDVFNVNREDVIGKKVTEHSLVDPDTAVLYHQEYLRVMEEGQPCVQDRILTMADGREVAIYSWLLPYRDSDGVVIGLIAGWIDISERQRLLEQVQEAKEAAERANRAKTTFLATMSHEIRTPMSAVIGMLELATKKADQGILDRFAIDVASGAARGLLDLIGDILDVARIESGRLSLSPERASLRLLIESLLRVFEGLAKQKRLKLVLDFDCKADQDVLIDPLRFKQVISNLLSNAIKFTSEGEVRLTLEVLPSASPERLPIRLCVKDTGVGISEEDQQRLFTPYGQAGGNSQLARSGSGLGLVISRTLCEMMGGELHLFSEAGKGTEIEVMLDLLALDPAPIVAIPAVELDVQRHVLNILVVDDYPANRQLLSQQLSYLGHRVVEAEDGAHGLRAWRKNHFDVVITDCRMPIMDGYALARAIRDDEKARGSTPCLVLGFTANVQPDEKERCIDAGMDDCLFKSITLVDLSHRLASVASAIMLPQAEPEPSAQSASIDLVNLEQLTRGDRSSMDSLLNDLAESNNGDLARLSSLYSEQNLQGLADLAHRVRGGARIIKAHALIAACEQLEAVCAAGHGEQLLEQAVMSLGQEMSALAITLRRIRNKS